MGEEYGLFRREGPQKARDRGLPVGRGLQNRRRWSEAAQRSIGRSDAVLILWTPKAVGSKVEQEVGFALLMKKPIGLIKDPSVSVPTGMDPETIYEDLSSLLPLIRFGRFGTRLLVPEPVGYGRLLDRLTAFAWRNAAKKALAELRHQHRLEAFAESPKEAV